MDLRLEPLEPPRIEELLVLLRERAQWLIDRGTPMWNPAYLEKEAFVQRYPGLRCFLVKDPDPVGGFVLIERDEVFWKDHPQDRVHYVHKLVVTLGAQGRGYGPRILEAIADLSRSEGRRALRVDYYEAHRALERLYLGCGFEKRQTLTMTDGVRIALAEHPLSSGS